MPPTPAPSRAAFARHLRHLRDAANLSQRALGGLVHVTPDAVATWEKGRSLPGDERTAAALDASLLFDRSIQPRINGTGSTASATWPCTR